MSKLQGTMIRRTNVISWFARREGWEFGVALHPIDNCHLMEAAIIDLASIPDVQSIHASSWKFLNGLLLYAWWIICEGACT